MAGFFDRIKTGFNVLTKGDGWLEPRYITRSENTGPNLTLYRAADTAVLAPIRNRIAIDASMVKMRHVTIDEDELYTGTIRSELNHRLSVQANIDQAATAFRHDLVTTMLQEGSVAAVPTHTSVDPERTEGYDILAIRACRVVEWYAKHVKVSVYNEETGRMQDVILPKSYVAISYNPMFAVMNDANSTLKRLVEKLSLQDYSDNQAMAPGLDLIVQLPMAIRTKAKREEAENRVAQLVEQLSKSRYGIGYIDATEKITQLNRRVDNNFLEQVSILEEKLHNQLGLTPSIFNGTASQEEWILYLNRSIVPVNTALTESMKVAFLSRTAISRGQSIMCLPDLFKMVPLSEIADAADKFTRNKIMTGNQVRQHIGLRPVDDPAADKLENPNIKNKEPDMTEKKEETPTVEEE